MPKDALRTPDGIEIAYETTGDENPGEPVVLVHGFASSLHTNWRLPGWIEAFERAGRRVIALDCRGHGESAKPHDPSAYAGWAMPGDVIALLDHLEIGSALLMGYSMGGRIASSLLADAGERFSRGVLAGVGGGMLQSEAEATRAEAIAHTLLADDPSRIDHPAARGFRDFAERQGGDLRALAACMRGMDRSITPDRLGEIEAPVLVVVGRDDDMVGDPRELAACIPGSELHLVTGRDHMTAVPARATKEAVFDFLGLELRRKPLPA